MSSLVSSAPRVRFSDPSSASSAALPKTLSLKLIVGTCSSAIWIDTGSSGRVKGLASTWGSGFAGRAGISARRSQAMRPALSRFTETRPRSSASRLQSSSTLSISSQAPRASEMVMRWIRAREDSAPETPDRRICRPGVESRFSSRFKRKPLSLSSDASCASAVIATSTSTPSMTRSRFKTPVRCRCRARRPSRPRPAATVSQRRSAGFRSRYSSGTRARRRS